MSTSGVQQASKFRPYLAAVIATLMIVLLFSRQEDGSAPDAGRITAAGPVDTGGAGPVAGETAAPVDAYVPPYADAPQAAASGGSPSVGSSAPRAGAPAGGTAAPAPGAKAPAAQAVKAPASATGFPGTGTKEALANPDCDPATKKVRWPDQAAPPCVLAWPAGADNGGTTSSGVTDKEIRIASYSLFSATATDAKKRETEGIMQDYINGFNKVYELWGRKLVIKFFYGSGSDEVAQRSDALQIARDYKPFALIAGAQGTEVFMSEMASHGVITTQSFGQAWKGMQQQAPYRWSYSADDRMVVLPVLEFVAKRVAQFPVRWSKDVTLRGKPRVLGLVHPTTWDRAFIDAQAARLGIRFADAIAMDENDYTGAQERARVIIARFKDKGVTTIVDGATLIWNAALTKEATVQLYGPEWVVTGASFQDTVIYSRTYDQTQWAHAFGVGPLGPLPPLSKIGYVSVYRWLTGREPSDTIAASVAYYTSQQLANGIMLAGPKLNPTTYRDAHFNNPPVMGSWCGCTATVGLSYGRHNPAMPWDDYSGWDDVTEKWWDAERPSEDEVGLPGRGGYMKIDGGKRYTPGSFPNSEPKAFDPNGAVERLPDWPPGEGAPSYPSPK